jgi:hypothetical protein
MSEPAQRNSLEPGAPSDEEQAWARVLASWSDEAAHQAYLACCRDMDGYAVAGGRYRAVLAERPEDAMALRMRDEVVRKATVFGLALLPRARRTEAPRWARWLLLALALLVLLGAIVAAAKLFYRLAGARP